MTSPDPSPFASGPAAAPLSPARRALAEFAMRSPATQADVDQVMRALVTHESWIVPVSFARRAWGQTDFAHTIGFPDAPPASVLSVFTDDESARLAQGQPIGAYGGPVPGVRLMRALDAEFTALIVNPASPREHQWYIAPAGFEIAAGWASTVAVEQALAARGAGPAPTAALLAHRYQLLLEKATRALAQITLPDIDGMVAVCFTATDRGEEFISCLPRAARPLADLAPIDGPRLFDLLHSAGAAGLVINAGSDDQTALTREDIIEITGPRVLI